MFGPGCVCQPVDWFGPNVRCCSTPLLPWSWLIARVNAETDSTFNAVLPASVPSGTAPGGTVVEGSAAYAIVAATPSANRPVASAIFLFPAIFLILPFVRFSAARALHTHAALS